MKFLRIIIGGITGLVLSALFGAVVFGLSTYINGNPTFGWTMAVAVWASLFCSGGGLVLGLVLGTVDCTKRWGTLIGAAFALIFVTYSLSAGWLAESKLVATIFSLAFVCGGGLVGLLTVIFTSMARSKRGGVLQS